MKNPSRTKNPGEKQLHTISPVFDKDSEILILGSFPSVKSRESCFFYGHPKNRFWSVLAEVFADTLPETIEEKRSFLLKHHVAVWDVIASCTIKGSSDSSISDAVPNDLSKICAQSQVRRVFTNGKLADRLYRKYLEEKTHIQAVCLPSTSPANAAWSLENLVKAWGGQFKSESL